MNRDHLLGCRQFIPDVENEPFTPVYRKLMSVRQEKELAEQWRKNRGFGERDTELTLFEAVDHTPPEMKKAKKPVLSGDWGLSSIDREWTASWDRAVAHYVERLVGMPPVRVGIIDPTRFEEDFTSVHFTQVDMAPKAQTATEVMLKLQAARQSINDILYPSDDRFYGAQPEEWNLPPDER